MTQGESHQRQAATAPRPRVWARAAAAAAANADGDEPFFFLAAGGMDISAHQIGDEDSVR